MTEGAVVHGRRPRRRTWRWVLASLAVALLAACVVMAIDVWGARAAAADLEAAAVEAQDAVEERDAPALEAAVEDLRAAAAGFAAHTDGPHWWLAAHTPWVGAQVRPLQQAGQAARAIAEDALAPLAAAGDLSAFEVPRLEGGRIDPWVLEPFRPALVTADAVLSEQLDALAAVDADAAISLVREPYLELQDRLARLAGLVAGARTAAELLPAVLGGDQPRDYVVVVQNNAEPRTTGGIPGALIALHVDQGLFTMGEYQAANALETAQPVADLTGEELAIFTERMAIYPMDANFTPEFPRTGQLLSDFWAASGRERPDGVISVDAVALGYLVDGAPATTVDGFEIDGDNLARVMLQESYETYARPQEQDAFFARAAAALFSTVIDSGEGLVEGIERAVDQRRLMVWLADADQQAALEGTGLAGTFLSRDDALGVFVNDGSGSKIGWYVDAGYRLTDVICPDGTLGFQELAVTLRHTYEGDVAALPHTVGIGGGFVPPGEFHANVLVYPARQGWVAGLSSDGTSVGWNSQSQEGRSLASTRVTLAPGDSVTLTYALRAPRGASVPEQFQFTPGPRESAVERHTREAGAGDCE